MIPIMYFGKALLVDIFLVIAWVPISQQWMKDDNIILNQILNSMEYHIQDLVRHCTTVKELWLYLESLYASKHNLFHVHELLAGLYRESQKGRPLLQYYSDVKRMFEEMNTLYPLPTDIKQMLEQCEAINVQCFLAGLDSNYEVARTQLLMGSKLSGKLCDVFSRLQRVCKDAGKDNSAGEKRYSRWSGWWERWRQNQCSHLSSLRRTWSY